MALTRERRFEALVDEQYARRACTAVQSERMGRSPTLRWSWSRRRCCATATGLTAAQSRTVLGKKCPKRVSDSEPNEGACCNSSDQDQVFGGQASHREGATILEVFALLQLVWPAARLPAAAPAACCPVVRRGHPDAAVPAPLREMVRADVGEAWKVHAYRHPANIAPTTACPTNWCALSTQKIQIGAVP